MKMIKWVLCLGLIVCTSGVVWAVPPVQYGLVKDLDAGAISDPNGSPVSVWPDLSGTQDMVQTNAGSQPIYIASSNINGMPVVRFDGVDDFLDATDNSTDLFKGDNPFVVFVVCKVAGFGNGGPEDRSLFAIAKKVSGNREVSIFAFENATTTGDRLYGGWPHWSTNLTLNQPVLLENGYTGGGQHSYYLAVNGTANTNATFNNDSTHNFRRSTIRLGYTTMATGTIKHFKGDVAEFLVYNRNLSQDEINSVGTYLADKYGLSSSYTAPGPYVLSFEPKDGSKASHPDAVNFVWEGHATGTVSYKLYYDTDDNVDDGTVVTLTDNSYTAALKIGTQYWWRVDMIVDGTTYQSDVKSFTTAGKVEGTKPADGATRIGQDTKLSWDPVDAAGVSYDVYFGTSATPAMVTNTTQTEYTPQNTLDPNTVYYYRIDATRNGNTVTGDVSSFRTGGMAVNPQPSGDQASTMPLLEWAGDATGSYIEEYDVYFGSTPNPPYVATVTGTSWQEPDELAEMTTYYWKVVPKHGGSPIVTYQPVWSFTTGKLLAYWPFDNDPNDVVASKYGTLVKKSAGASDPNYIPGVVGNACEFHGDSFYKTDSSSYWNSTSKSITVAAWVKWDMAADTNRELMWAPFVCKNDSSTASKGWSLHLYKYYFLPQMRTGTATTSGNEMYDIDYQGNTHSTWHFLVAAVSPQSRKLWVDGNLVKQAGGVSPYDIGTAPVCLGGRQKGNGDWERGLVGALDEVRIYNYALSEPQMLKLYKNSAMAKLPEPADGQQDVAFNVNLSWTPGAADAGVAGQKLYFGMQPDLSDATIVTLSADASSYDIAGTLIPDTAYFWKVDSLAADGSVLWPGKTWSFQVGSLTADIVKDNKVDSADLQAFAADWLSDSRSIPTGDATFDWTKKINAANANNYLYALAGYYSKNWWEINNSPEMDPNVPIPSISKTVQWHFDLAGTTWGDIGQIEAGFVFPEPIDLSNVNKVTIWVKSVNVVSNGYYVSPSWFICWMINTDDSVFSTPTFKPIDPLTEQPIGFTEVSDARNGAGRWVKLEWDTSSITTVWKQMELWYNWSGTNRNTQKQRGLPAYWEFGDIVLTYADGTTEPACWMGSKISPADFNEDCDVNLTDFSILAKEWLMDLNH